MVCVSLGFAYLLCGEGTVGVFNNNNNNNKCIQRRSSRFCTISSLRCELSPTRTLKWARYNRVKITCNTSSIYHVHRVVCHLVQGDSSAAKFDRVEIAFILALLYWLKPLADESDHRDNLSCKFSKLSVHLLHTVHVLHSFIIVDSRNHWQ